MGVKPWVRGWAVCAAALFAAGASPPSRAEPGLSPSGAAEEVSREASGANTPESREAERNKHHDADFSGKKRVGKASFYAKEFEGKPMADGARMDPQGNNAASKTLPLGTTAKVTNLETGQSAVVMIRDRGPFVPGRIVDLSPATARQIGITQRKGVAPVVVAPITVPQPDGRIKLGAAVHEPLFEPEHPKPGYAVGEHSTHGGSLREADAHAIREVHERAIRERPLREATADASALHTR